MTDYLIISHVPPGLSQQNRIDAKQAWRNGVGLHNEPQPCDNTEIRPNNPDNPEYWIMSGTLAGVTIDDIAQTLADYLSVPVAPIKNNIVVTPKSHAEVLIEIANNKSRWGEA